MAAYRKLFERASPEHPLTPKKLRVLCRIAECRLLTPPQIVTLTGLSAKAVQLHLRDLFDLGLVERCGVPRAALADVSAPNEESLLWGRAPTVYTLSRTGALLLLQQSLVEKEQVAELPQYGPRNALFLAHEIEVRDVRVWLEQVSRRYDLPGVEEWRDGTRAVLGPARPDAWFRLRLHAGLLVGLVEVDRGTERSPSRWQEKLAGYATLFQSTLIPTATGAERARVLAITPDARHRDRIGQVIGEALPKLRMLPDRFWLAEKSALASPDLAAAVWRVPGRSELMPLVPPDVIERPTGGASGFGLSH